MKVQINEFVIREHPEPGRFYVNVWRDSVRREYETPHSDLLGILAWNYRDDIDVDITGDGICVRIQWGQSARLAEESRINEHEMWGSQGRPEAQR